MMTFGELRKMIQEMRGRVYRNGITLGPGAYHIGGTCTGRFSDGRQLTFGPGYWTFKETVTLEPMNPREQQLVEALEASKKYLEERAPEKIGGNLMEFVEASLLRKKIGDALDAVRTGPQFYESKFHAKWSQNWRIKVERLKQSISELESVNACLRSETRTERERADGLSAQVGRLQDKLRETLDALNSMTDAYHKAIAERDEARRDSSRVTATECQLAFANEHTLRSEVARLRKLCKHYLDQRDDWNSKWAALAEKLKTLANEN